jgi:hypothetical protein
LLSQIKLKLNELENDQLFGRESKPKQLKKIYNPVERSRGRNGEYLLRTELRA